MNPIQGPNGLPGLPPAGPAGKPAAAGAARDEFANLIREQLEKVNSLQGDADKQVEAVLAGESDSMTDVFVAARKAEVAFSLLMEVRNKLVDAYDELKNLRV